MLISIVIPVYNRATVVGRTLDCVSQQSHRPLEVVLVDNDSSDGTLDVLEEWAATHRSDDFAVKVERATACHTAAAARQHGFEHATGEYVMFFDSDDLMAPDLVEAYAKTVERHPEADIVLARAQLQAQDGSQRELPFHSCDLIANQILHSLLSSQRYLVRRAFFAATDGWNINLLQWDDWELGIRLLLARPRMTALPGKPKVTLMASGDASITGTEFASRAGRWEYAIDVSLINVGSSLLKTEHKQRFMRLLEYRRMVLAAHYQQEGRADLARPLCQQAVAALRESYTTLRRTERGTQQQVARRYRWIVEPALRRLFAHIASGKRGAARIARLLF